MNGIVAVPDETYADVNVYNFTRVLSRMRQSEVMDAMLGLSMDLEFATKRLCRSIGIALMVASLACVSIPVAGICVGLAVSDGLLHVYRISKYVTILQACKARLTQIVQQETWSRISDATLFS